MAPPRAARPARQLLTPACPTLRRPAPPRPAAPPPADNKLTGGVHSGLFYLGQIERINLANNDFGPTLYSCLAPCGPESIG
jgi:hypothetical protein